MKKLILLFTTAILMSAVTVQAQQKGDLFIGGNLGFSISTIGIDGDSAIGTSFEIAPEVGYFPIDNLKVGGQIGYILSNDTHTLTIMPSVGYYIKLCPNVYYTPTFSAGYAYVNDYGFGMSGFGMQLNIFDIECRIFKKGALSINALSLSYAVLAEYGETANIISFGFNPTVGFRYYF